jgi:hypothetical protein
MVFLREKRFLLFVGVCLPALLAFAQPDLRKEADTSLLENASLYYVFETFEESADAGGSSRRIHVAVPKRKAPEGG